MEDKYNDYILSLKYFLNASSTVIFTENYLNIGIIKHYYYEKCQIYFNNNSWCNVLYFRFWVERFYNDVCFFFRVCLHDK